RDDYGAVGVGWGRTLELRMYDRGADDGRESAVDRTRSPRLRLGRCRHGTPERSRKHRLAAAESGHGSAPKDNAAANCSARPTGSTRIFSAPCPIQPIFESPHHGYGRRRQLWLQRAEYDLDRVPFRHVQLAIERHSVAALRRLQGDRLPWQPGEAWHRWHP